MEFRRFGLTEELVPVVGQGTWHINNEDPDIAIRALKTGIDAGMKHIDTAEMYTGAEELVRHAIKGRRNEVFLVSKVLPQHATYAGTIAACEASLERLDTDYLDCYLLHWRGSVPLVETFSAFEQLMNAGMILSWGVSNFDVPDLEEAWELAGPGGLVCNQVLYNIMERAIEHEVLPWCEAHGLAVTAYSPFGHGNFPGPDTPQRRVLMEVASAHNATPRQVALRFLLRYPSVFAIPKASRPEHAVENAGAGSLQLTEEDIVRLDVAFPRGPKPRALPVL